MKRFLMLLLLSGTAHAQVPVAPNTDHESMLQVDGKIAEHWDPATRPAPK